MVGVQELNSRLVMRSCGEVMVAPLVLVGRLVWAISIDHAGRRGRIHLLFGASWALTLSAVLTQIPRMSERCRKMRKTQRRRWEVRAMDGKRLEVRATLWA